MARYDILIPTRPRRYEKLCALLAELDRQMQPGARVLIYRDDKAESYGEACQALLDMAAADYIAYFDDDDWPYPGYMKEVMAALEGNPDYVGWPQPYTINGQFAGTIVHSLHDHSAEIANLHSTAGIVHKNPLRREIAQLGKWSGQYGADRNWWAQIEATGLVKTEAWISEPVYEYRFSTFDQGLTPWYQYDEPWPVFPSYDWLTVTDAL